GSWRSVLGRDILQTLRPKAHILQGWDEGPVDGGKNPPSCNSVRTQVALSRSLATGMFGRLVGKDPTVKHPSNQRAGPGDNQAGHPPPGTSRDAQDCRYVPWDTRERRSPERN